MPPIKLSNEISLWAHRLALYFSIYIVVIGFYLLISRFNFWHPGVNNINELLGNLIQMEAAIIAIVISLSIVAVELAASSYSTRLVDVFIDYKKNPDFWILLSIYGITIFYGLFVQLNSPSNLKAHISLAYYLGIFAFVASVPYILSTLDMLKPSTVINMQMEEITKRSILDAIVMEGEKKLDDKYGVVNVLTERVIVEKDPIQPIIDIVLDSLMKHDYVTLKDGLRAITYRTEDIFKNEKPEELEGKKVLLHISSHLTRVGIIAASENDEESTEEVIDNLQKNGERAVREALKYVTEGTIISLGKIGFVAIEQNLASAPQRVVKALKDLGLLTIKKQELEFETHMLLIYLRDIGLTAAKHEHILISVIGALDEIGKTAVKLELVATAKVVTKCLNIIRENAVESRFLIASKILTESLEEINEAISKLEEQ